MELVTQATVIAAFDAAGGVKFSVPVESVGVGYTPDTLHLRIPVHENDVGILQNLLPDTFCAFDESVFRLALEQLFWAAHRPYRDQLPELLKNASRRLDLETLLLGYSDGLVLDVLAHVCTLIDELEVNFLDSLSRETL